MYKRNIEVLFFSTTFSSARDICLHFFGFMGAFLKTEMTVSKELC